MHNFSTESNEQPIDEGVEIKAALLRERDGGDGAASKSEAIERGSESYVAQQREEVSVARMNMFESGWECPAEVPELRRDKSMRAGRCC